MIKSLLILCMTGMLSARAFTAETTQPAAKKPSPTLTDVPYGDHPRQVLDFWKAQSDQPTPLVFFMHGGGWMKGDKKDINKRDFEKYLEAGISVVSINYRYVQHAKDAGVNPPVAWPLHDAARALQFVRSRSAEWNIDKERIAASGSSAGACSSLWLAFHDDLADPRSNDPIARESTRLWCAAVHAAQTTLDPQQMHEWTPNSRYGGHAFGYWDGKDDKTRDTHFAEFLKHRDEHLSSIKQYSPYHNASAGDPPIYLLYDTPPAIGKPQKDPTHTSNFGVKLQERLDELKVKCELVYPGAPNVRHASIEAFLIENLKDGLKGKVGAAVQQNPSERIRLVLVGDSTVSQYDETHANRGWGQYIGERFKDGAVEVVNLAAPGRSTKTFIEEGRWKKALEQKPDFVLIQFGHNDSHNPANPESTDFATDYKDYLRRYVDETRAIGARPIFITPMVRRTFDENGKVRESQPAPNRSLADYAAAMKAIAEEKRAPLIDLYSLSLRYAEKIGPQASLKLASQEGDVTHFNEKGARAMADLIGSELSSVEPSIKAYLKSEEGRF